MAWIATAVAVVGTVYSIDQQKQAAKSQRRAERKQQTLAEISASRQRTEAVRQARLQRARASNIAEQGGVGLSSGLAGGIASSLTQTGAAIGYQNTQTAYGQAIGRDINRAGQFSANAQMGSVVANFAGGMVDWKQVGGSLQQSFSSKG